MHAGLGRRLGAILYDSLLLTAVLMIVSIPFVLVTGGATGNTYTRLLFQLYLLPVIFFYYAWFWVRSGQTLGMLTWKLRVVTADGATITWRQALQRFAAASLSILCLGLGFFWILVDRDRLAWHDRLSGTRVVRIKQN